jgi:hypothetical protein
MQAIGVAHRHPATWPQHAKDLLQRRTVCALLDYVAERVVGYDQIEAFVRKGQRLGMRGSDP